MGSVNGKKKARFFSFPLQTRDKLMCVHMRCPGSAARWAWSARLSPFLPQRSGFNFVNVVGTESLLFRRASPAVVLGAPRCAMPAPGPTAVTAPAWELCFPGKLRRAPSAPRLGAASPRLLQLKPRHKPFGSARGAAGRAPAGIFLFLVPLNISCAALGFLWSYLRALV